jgi:large subunit ribosomal protein L29
MKRKDKENLKNMSEAELKAQLRDLEKHLFQTKFKRASSPLENPLEIRLVRRKMAMIRTFLGMKGRAASVTETLEVKK